MKNLHVLPTDKPSRLHTYFNLPNYLLLSNKALNWKEAKHIYIISDERIERGDWLFDAENEEYIYRASDVDLSNIRSLKSWYCKKIILTTDQDLIKYGVQAVEEDFLNWFVKNPSCEWIEVEKYNGFKTKKAGESWLFENDKYNWKGDSLDYKIIIPKEEPNQETLEEFAKQEAIKQYSEDTFGNLIVRKSIEKGAKWQSEQENTANDILNYILTNDDGVGIALGYNSREMIEQHFKNIGYER